MIFSNHISVNLLNAFTVLNTYINLIIYTAIIPIIDAARTRNPSIGISININDAIGPIIEHLYHFHNRDHFADRSSSTPFSASEVALKK